MGLVRRLAAALAVVALCWTTGCGGFWVYPGTSSTSSNSKSGNIVYVANSNTETVSAYVVGTGTLTAVSGSPYSLAYIPTALAINPANSILFVALSGGVYTYSIGTGGVLTALTSGVTTGLGNIVSMDVSPDGQWLFALSGDVTSNVVTVYEFKITTSTGALTLQSGVGSYSVTPNGSTTPNPTSVKVALVSSGEYVYVAMGTAGELWFTFDTSTGAQTNAKQMSITSLTTNTADNALAVNATTSTLYIARSHTTGAPGQIAAYTIGSEGYLTLVAQATTGAMPKALTLNTTGSAVYAANNYDGTISGFSTTVNGSTLTGLTSSPYRSGLLVNGLAPDRSGSYLLAIAQGGSPDLTMYSFDSSTAGMLDSTASTSTGTYPATPVAIATTH